MSKVALGSGHRTGTSWGLVFETVTAVGRYCSSMWEWVAHSGLCEVLVVSRIFKSASDGSSSHNDVVPDGRCAGLSHESKDLLG